METYSVAFTIPRSTGHVAYPGERPNAAPGSNVGTAGGLGTAPSTSGASAGGMSFGSSLLSGSSSFLGFDRADAQQSQQQRHRPPDASTFGRLGSMRSRLPPSVKAFMPAAFGGLKRTSERIAEAAAGSEKESETEAEAEEPSASAARDGAKKKVKDKDKDAPKEVGKPTDVEAVDAKARLPGKSMSATQTRGELKDKSEKESKDEAKSVAEAADKPDTTAHEGDDATTSGIGDDDKSAGASADGSNGNTDVDDGTTAAASNKSRASQSTIGTTSSADASPAASVESTAASTAPLGSTRTHQTPPEPRSATHSASNSLSIFGAQQSSYFADDLAESMQRLSTDTMQQFQCLVSNTSVQNDGVRTLHPNGSSTSINSMDPYNRHTFPSMPPAAPHFQHMAQSMDSIGSGASPFGNHAFSQSRSSISSIVPSTSQMPSQAPRGSSKRTHYNFHISGNVQQVMAARGQILRDHPFRTKQTIKVPLHEITRASPPSTESQSIIASEYLRYEVRKRLEDISLASNCLITVTSKESQKQQAIRGLETERYAEVAISGHFEAAEQATTRVMVMLDELSGLHTETCEIDYKLHNVIGGRKRSVAQKIMEETSTNIYMPTPFPGVLSANHNPAVVVRQNTVFITGENSNVQRARDMLYQVSMSKHKSIISRNTALLHRKIDWLLTERLEDLRSIMLDNATFISLPTLGSQSNVITVFGDSRVSIERSIRSIMQLACQFFVAQIWLLPVVFDGVMASTPLSSTQMAPVLKHISTLSGAEVSFHSNSFEMYGLEVEVRQAVALILEMDVLKPHNVEVRFQIELANEHREFISGKKNGKINKIMKQGIRVKFESFNDYNFLIDVASNDRIGTLQGLNLLLEELPAEVSFHIPEIYHKRIIGVGGKNIQKTMKKFGVYVKFYSKQDLDIETYPFLEAEDNVIARTPAKNSVNLDNLKAAVMELVSPKDKDFVSENVPIARRYHRTLLGEKGVYIHDIELKLGCMIRFPPPESANDLVSIFGPESQIHVATQMLLDHVPCEAEFRAPQSASLTRLLGAQEFVALTERVKRDLNITIEATQEAPSSGKPDTGRGDAAEPASELKTDASPTDAHVETHADVVFKLKLNRSSIDFLPAAKDSLKDFLISRNISVYSTNERNRSDSFASSFQHFANKLISVPQAAGSTDSFQTDAAARFRETQTQEQKSQLRAAASTPDIKALFDSPAVGHGTFVPGHTASGLSSVAPAYSMAPAQTAMRNALYSSPYPAPTSLGGSEVWGAPTLPQQTIASRPSTVSLSDMQQHMPSQTGISFPQQADPRLSGDFAMQPQMSSDDLLSNDVDIEDRGNARKMPRAYSHRAQSLDIGALAAQQLVKQISAGGAARGVLETRNGSISSAGTPGQMKPSAANPSMPHLPFGAIGSRPASNASLRATANNQQRFSHSPTGSFFGSGNENFTTSQFAPASAHTTTNTIPGNKRFGGGGTTSMGGPPHHQHAPHHSTPLPLNTPHMTTYQAGQHPPRQQPYQQQPQHLPGLQQNQQYDVASASPRQPFFPAQRPPVHSMGASIGGGPYPAQGNYAMHGGNAKQHAFAGNAGIPSRPSVPHFAGAGQQQYTPHHHHHAPSPSITRLGPSSMQRGPEPETTDEVLRSLAQLNFSNPSA